ncbi:glycosyltransferase [Paraglaciecola chathamensis]|jgi:glycosyltransferase involved in cell wall biosynthesis|uniref:Glycosyltransferase n=1 Tax=Paraglaciecola chathamensis TaxID=368405 RepID=A0ABS0WBU1_9ALTE|nr:glycosyltransferase [Paraglaciecola chathamensis]MBJ2135947.1 glycosyltransferase [Paraglaciecola chathamensis]|tara:strand:- start:759 stop:1628 length:870 start_codon:yes stop_codon:yes gene_type:complete
MSVLVSVVIPVYNSQSYISDCINSVLAQTYPHFEVIAIDDGSTDSSVDILKSFQKSQNIKLLQIENSGQSVARNLGIEHAKGKYLIFIDSDDCWKNNTLNVVVSLAEKKQLDMVLFDGESFVDDKIIDEQTTELLSAYLTKGFKPDTYVRNAPEEVFNGGDFLAHQMDNNKFIASPVLYLYKLEKFRNIRFVPSIIHEDNAFTMELLVKNGKVMATPNNLYRRRIRQNSIMTSPKTMRNVNGHLAVLKRMAEVFCETEDADIKSTINRVMRMTLANCARCLKQIDGDLS